MTSRRVEITKRMEQAEELVAGGMSVSEACEKVGLSKPTYYARLASEDRHPKNLVAKKKKRGPYKKKQQEIIEIEMPPVAAPEKVFMFYGTPEQIQEVLKGLS